MKYRFIILFSLILYAEACFSNSPGGVAVEILKQSYIYKSICESTASSVSAIKTEANLPDPEIEGEYLVSGTESPDRWGAGIAWGLEWPGVYSTRNSLVKKKEISELRLQDVRVMETLADIKRLLLNYIYEEKQMEILNSIVNSNDSLLKVCKKSMDSGYGPSVLDINKLKVELAQAKTQLKDVESSRISTVGELKGIYGKDPSGLLDGMTKDFFRVPIPSDLTEAIEKSPSIQEAVANVAVAKAEERTVKWEGLPNLTIGYRHAYEDGNHFSGPTVGISLPIFSQKGKRKAAKANVLAAETQAESVRSKITESVLANAQRYNLMLGYIAEVMPSIVNPENFRLLSVAFNGGQLPLSEYLRERSYYFNAMLDLTKIEFDATSILLDIEEKIKW